ncbi:MAG: D-cysteine desulfhydrase family protein [Aminobacterium colombiense]|nr:D-cysteine desulfhydrase family protein [Aminobacterium colombiense]
MKDIQEIERTLNQLKEALPRVNLAFLPTPLHKLPRLSRQYDIELFIKRDDLTGIELGGNKTRKLEFVLPDALAAKADYIITGASIQSNWCRQMVSACVQCGLKTILYLFGPNIPTECQGNLLLDKTLGAEVHLIKLNEGENLYDGLNRTEKMRKKRIQELDDAGHNCFYLKVGAPFPKGHAAYVWAMAELVHQLQNLGMTLDDLDYIVTPLGAGGTYAGLFVAKKLFESKVKIYGYCTSGMHPTMEDDILNACRDTAHFLGVDLSFGKSDIHVSFDYGGEYDVPTPKSTEAIKHVARSEGVLLDPVYTAKAMSGLLDYLEKGLIPSGSRVLFWHTGGLPALFSGRETAGTIYE